MLGSPLPCFHHCPIWPTSCFADHVPLTRAREDLHATSRGPLARPTCELCAVARTMLPNRRLAAHASTQRRGGRPGPTDTRMAFQRHCHWGRKPATTSAQIRHSPPAQKTECSRHTRSPKLVGAPKATPQHAISELAPMKPRRAQAAHNGRSAAQTAAGVHEERAATTRIREPPPAGGTDALWSSSGRLRVSHGNTTWMPIRIRTARVAKLTL